MSKPQTEKQKKEENIKKLSNISSGYTEELLNFVRDNFIPTADNVILKPTIVTHTTSGLLIGDPKVAQCADIVSVGEQCKVARPGMKAILNFPTIGNLFMYKFEIQGKMFVTLMESQLICVYPGDITIPEEVLMEKPETKYDDGMAFMQERVNTELILPS
jgi:hypothetical protein